METKSHPPGTEGDGFDGVSPFPPPALPGSGSAVGFAVIGQNPSQPGGPKLPQILVFLLYTLTL